jgi:DNA primase small subunit
MVAFIINYVEISNKHYFSNREFSFTLQGDIYMRFLSFNDDTQLKNEIIRLCPVKIDIGAVYNIKPKEKKTVINTAFIVFHLNSLASRTRTSV